MRYLGGKHRQAREVASAVERLRGGRSRYVEPFVGGGSVLAAVAPSFETFEASDVVPELVALWTAVQCGWIPPAELSEEDWRSLKASPDATALKGWAAYAASYNGKYFAGYGPTAAGRDYLAESRRGILRKARAIGTGAVFTCQDYADCKVDSNTVVYCDPPYSATEGYQGAGSFEHGRFWQVLREWSDTGALVLAHEYSAPMGWIPVHSRARVETMDHGGPSSGARVETIWMYPW